MPHPCPHCGQPLPAQRNPYWTPEIEAAARRNEASHPDRAKATASTNQAFRDALEQRDGRQA